MKKQNLICLIAILMCICLLLGYQALDNIRTDTKKPEINISEELPAVSILDSTDAFMQGISAWDETDGDVTGSLVVESMTLVDEGGTVSVTYAAFDRSGNVAKATRNIQLTDYVSPRFSLSQSLDFTSGREYDLFSIISAQDTLDGNISHRVRATSMDDTSLTAAGIHNVEFRVTNSLGDTAKLILPIEVYAPNTYDASVVLSDYLIYLDKDSSFNPNLYLESYVRGSETVSLSSGMPSGFSLQLTGSVDTHTPGVYPISYRVTQALDNSRRYTGYARLIVVVEG